MERGRGLCKSHDRERPRRKPGSKTGKAGHLFCFGLGFSARYLADRLLAQGWRVSGTCRSPENSSAVAMRGIAAHLFDRDHAMSASCAASLVVTACAEFRAAGCHRAIR